MLGRKIRKKDAKIGVPSGLGVISTCKKGQSGDSSRLSFSDYMGGVSSDGDQSHDNLEESS